MTRTFAFTYIRSIFRDVQFNPTQMVSVARQRRDLAKLDPHLLRDIGVTPAEACAEADRGFWDAPQSWKC